MKIQCNVCEVAEAAVLCCADEAALCTACDEQVHAANKLASKHPRVPLSNSSSTMPKCDICQDSIGYFFCLEDRSLLCRKCDLSIHSANPFVSSHQRFLLTGVRVEFEPLEHGSSSSMGMSPSLEKLSDTETRSVQQISAAMKVDCQYDKEVPARNNSDNLTPTKRTAPISFVGEYDNEMLNGGGGIGGDYTQLKMSFGGGSGSSDGNLPLWHMDDFSGFNEYNQNFGYMDLGSSKDYVFFSISSEADNGKFGDSDSSSIPRASEDDLDIDERLGQVPEIGRSGLKIPSPPTASGLFWPRPSQELTDNALFVPDIRWSQDQNSHQHCSTNGHTSRRRRQF